MTVSFFGSLSPFNCYSINSSSSHSLAKSPLLLSLQEKVHLISLKEVDKIMGYKAISPKFFCSSVIQCSIEEAKIFFKVISHNKFAVEKISQCSLEVLNKDNFIVSVVSQDHCDSLMPKITITMSLGSLQDLYTQSRSLSSYVMPSIKE
jgi:hypothetical protein